jgi:hypothetical protein
MNSTLHFLHIFRLDFHLMGDGDYLGHDAMGILIEYVSAYEVTSHDGSHNISSRLNCCTSSLFDVAFIVRQQLSFAVVLMVALHAVCLDLPHHHP